MKTPVFCFAKISLFIFHFKNLFSICTLVRVKLAGCFSVNSRFVPGSVCTGGVPGELERSMETSMIVLYFLPNFWGQCEDSCLRFSESVLCSDRDRWVHSDKMQTGEGQRAVWRTPPIVAPLGKSQEKVCFFLWLPAVLQDMQKTWVLLRRAVKEISSIHYVVQDVVVTFKDFTFSIPVTG